MQIGAIAAEGTAGRAFVRGVEIALTPVQFELLFCLASHSGEVLSTEQLLQQVWQYPPGTGNPSLVRMYVFNLRGKIESDRKKPEHLRTIPRHGYTPAL